MPPSQVIQGHSPVPVLDSQDPESLLPPNTWTATRLALVFSEEPGPSTLIAEAIRPSRPSTEGGYLPPRFGADASLAELTPIFGDASHSFSRHCSASLARLYIASQLDAISATDSEAGPLEAEPLIEICLRLPTLLPPEVLESRRYT